MHNQTNFLCCALVVTTSFIAIAMLILTYSNCSFVLFRCALAYATRFMLIFQKRSQLETKVALAKFLGNEAAEEPRMWRPPWATAAYGKCIKA